MKFYFYNSYSQSHTGYQLTQIELGQQALRLVNVKRFAEPEIESSLLNSGAMCLIGKSSSDKNYFLLRGIKVADISGRTWYINVAVEANSSNSKDYDALVSNILLNHNEFRKLLSKCFIAQDGELSYQIHSTLFWDYISKNKAKLSTEFPFFQKSNGYIQRLTTALDSLHTMRAKDILLLVPESTNAYFLKHNLVFRNAKIRSTIPMKPFLMLISQDPRVLTMNPSAENATSKKVKTNSASANIDRNGRVLLGGLALLTLAVFAYSAVDNLFGDDEKK